MNKKEILTKLIDQKKAAVLQVILNSKEEMYLKEIAEKSNVPISSTFRILQGFTKLNIINKKEWKTSKVYFCVDNENVTFLKELFAEQYDGLQEFVKAVEDITEIQNIILHGPKNKNKANILLIGTEININKVEEACNNVKNKGFELSYLTLAKEQYLQMVKMGLYSGEKKVLKP